MKSSTQGLLVVLSGPSGAGKGTLCKQLLKELPNLRYSVSATTREPRPGEVEGKDYYFVSRAQFDAMIDAGQMLEHAEFCGHYYGTPWHAVEQAITAGTDVILEIEIQGALQIKQRFPQGVFIFILPPSLDELASRIKKRGTESSDVIQQRLNEAVRELEYVSEYDYVVVNDQVELAVEKLTAIIKAEKCREKRSMVKF